MYSIHIHSVKYKAKFFATRRSFSSYISPIAHNSWFCKTGNELPASCGTKASRILVYLTALLISQVVAFALKMHLRGLNVIFLLTSDFVFACALQVMVYSSLYTLLNMRRLERWRKTNCKKRTIRTISN